MKINFLEDGGTKTIACTKVKFHGRRVSVHDPEGLVRYVMTDRILGVLDR